MQVSGRMEKKTAKSSLAMDEFCTPCVYFDRQEPVEGFCNVCKEYLCKECVQRHRGFRISRNHLILSGSEIPSKATQKTLPYTENCSTHPDEFLKYFCEDHDAFCCGSCTLNHRQCKLNAIKDLATYYQQSDQYRNLIADVTESEKNLSDIHENLPNFQQKAEALHNKVSADITSFHENICKQFSKNVDTLRQKAEDIANVNQNQVKMMTGNYETAHNTLVDIQKQLHKSRNSDIELFMTSKRLEKDISRLKTTTLEMKTRSVLTEFSFKPSVRLEKLAMDLKSVGDVIVETFDSSEELEEDNSFLDLSNASLKIVESISIRHHDDNSNSFISGMCSVINDRILVADNDNNALKLVDTVSGSITSRLHIDGSPWDVTSLPEEQAAATVRDKKLIKVVSTKVNLTTVRDIVVDGECWGICYNEGQFIVSFYSPVKCEIMNMQGEVYRVITDDLLTCPLYVNARCITGKTTIFISDSNMGHLIETNISGDIISVTPEKYFENPREPIFLEENVLAVASYDSANISLVSVYPGGMEFVKQLECDNKIAGMTYSKAKKLLYTCSYGSDMVKISSI